MIVVIVLDYARDDEKEDNNVKSEMYVPIKVLLEEDVIGEMKAKVG